MNKILGWALILVSLAVSACSRTEPPAPKGSEETLVTVDLTQKPASACKDEAVVHARLDELWQEVERQRTAKSAQDFFEPIRYCQSRSEHMIVSIVVHDEQGNRVDYPKPDQTTYRLSMRVDGRLYEIETDNFDFAIEFFRE